MKTLTKYIALLTLVALFSASSCKEECHDPANPDCENYDPCYGKTPFEADFIIEEVLTSTEGVLGLQDTSYVTDTVVAATNSSKTIRFTATGDYDTYHWQIGTDPSVFNTKSFNQYFEDPVTVWVTLIATRTPDTLCFPNDDGIDTVKKRLVVVPYTQSLVYGTFIGASTQKPDSNYTVQIQIDPFIDCPYRLTGLAACELTTACNDGWAMGYRGAIFKNNQNTTCLQGGFIYFDRVSNRLIIKYEQYTTNIGQINYYNGTKQ